MLFDPALFCYSPEKPAIGVSACLAGEPVRYDGSDKHCLLITETLARYADIVTLCPEAGAGMGVPRPKIQRMTSNDSNSVNVIETGVDVTRQLQDYANTVAADYNHRLQAFIVKSRSPSCGLGDTPFFDGQNNINHYGSGLFTDTLQKAWPQCFIVADSFLTDERQCHELLLRCLLINDWQKATLDKNTGHALKHYQAFSAYTNNKEQWENTLLDSRLSLLDALG